MPVCAVHGFYSVGMIGRGPTGPRVLLWWERAFWVIPIGGVLAGQALSQLAIILDEVAFELGREVGSPLLISASAATTTLAAIGGGMVTFTGFVFSFVVLLLQFGSSQYSPRTVSYFLRARSTQVILAIFLLTITFSFLTLLEVGSLNRADFAPQLSVPVAFGLLFASMAAFVALLGSVGGRMRVDAVVAALGRNAGRQLPRRFRPAAGWRPDVRDQGTDHVVVGYVGKVGQLVAVDERRLVRLAVRRRCSIALTVRVGDSVSPDVDVARVADRAGVARVQGTAEAAGGSVDLARAISQCLVVDVERSLRYDPLYSLRLIVDIALREALRPDLARHAAQLTALVEAARPAAEAAVVLAPDRQGLGGGQ